MTTYSGERMLVLAPHADDAEFGIGGWIARAKEEGVGVFNVVIAATGDYRRSDGGFVTENLRKREAAEAFKLLGVDAWRAAGWFSENGALAADYGRIVHLIAREIDHWQPTEVFCALPSFNQDHRVLFDAFVTALRPGMHKGVKNVWAYPYPGNCWGPAPPREGRCYLKLEQRHVDVKMQALAAHQSQWDGRSVGVNPQASLINMQQWGSEIGEPYAELVYLLREVY